MKRYEFTLWLCDDSQRDLDDWSNAIYEAGGDDTNIGERDGRRFAVFDREANSLDEALRSAMDTVQSAGLRVVTCEIAEAALATAWTV